MSTLNTARTGLATTPTRYGDPGFARVALAAMPDYPSGCRAARAYPPQRRRSRVRLRQPRRVQSHSPRSPRPRPDRVTHFPPIDSAGRVRVLISARR
ncbi:hypothetical protein F0Q45_26540 [Mycobacterium simiae]|uniref:Uncharacterized protein n=1 Tax=Mycobacterium simiae TaxID=1784 RepID=A0A5B1AXI0_MYCSI|nr:hypothetical protein [Mycobacterium simiae]KAA1241037.1 hypothetical protein F0Q45_26540 [Mycobacterium simiae]